MQLMQNDVSMQNCQIIAESPLDHATGFTKKSNDDSQKQRMFLCLLRLLGAKEPSPRKETNFSSHTSAMSEVLCPMAHVTLL